MLKELVELVCSKRWVELNDEPTTASFSTSEPMAGDYVTLTPFVAAGIVRLSAMLASNELYHIEGTGYPLFNFELDDQWPALFPECVDMARQHRTRLAEIRQDGAPTVEAYTELQHLHQLLLRYSGSALDLTINIDKSALVQLLAYGDNSPKVWFSYESFRKWLESSDLTKCLNAFGGGARPVFYVASDSKTFVFDDLIQDLCEMEPGSTALNYKAQSGYSISYETKLGEMSGVTNVPLIHPSLFYRVAPSRWEESPRMRELCAYATLCTFSYSVTIRQNSLTFRYRTPGTLNCAELAFRDGALVTHPKGDKVPVAADLVPALLSLCDEYYRSVGDSSSLSRVWQMAVESVVKTEFHKLISNPTIVLAQFRHLKEKLLDDSIGRVLAANEKAQGMVVQVSSQLTKDVDSLGSDVEKAILAGVGSGVIGLVGALSKVQAFDLAAVVTTGILATVLFPTVYGRIGYFQSSLDEREKDLETFFEALRRQTGDVTDLRVYQDRFTKHKSLASDQMKDARFRLSFLFVAIQALTLFAIQGALTYSTWSWALTIAGVVAAYSIYSGVVLRKASTTATWSLALSLVVIFTKLALRWFGVQ